MATVTSLAEARDMVRDFHARNARIRSVHEAQYQATLRAARQVQQDTEGTVMLAGVLIVAFFAFVVGVGVGRWLA